MSDIADEQVISSEQTIDNFDIDMYKQMLALTKQVPDLFHGH